MFRKKIFSSTLVFCASILIYSSQLCSQSKPVVAVKGLHNPPAYYNSNIGNALADIMITEMTKSGRFTMMERAEIGTLLDEIDFEQSDYVEQTSKIEKGKVKGIQYFVVGKVTNFSLEKKKYGGGGIVGGALGGVAVKRDVANVRIDFRLIDATTGETILADYGEGEEVNTGVTGIAGDLGSWVGAGGFDTKEFLASQIGRTSLAAIQDAIGKMAGYFPLQGTVTAVTPNAVFIDLGSAAGMEKGMKMKVYREELVRNSAGEVVFRDKQELGKVELTNVQLQTSKAKILSGSKFQEGDIVEAPQVKEGKKKKKQD